MIVQLMDYNTVNKRIISMINELLVYKTHRILKDRVAAGK